jgi:hypothetical protein
VGLLECSNPEKFKDTFLEFYGILQSSCMKSYVTPTGNEVDVTHVHIQRRKCQLSSLVSEKQFDSFS